MISISAIIINITMKYFAYSSIDLGFSSLALTLQNVKDYIIINPILIVD